mmetsp:Transcript_41017/g.30168  ORF Transcript_41017/g.30168 Transcript_41017/m.30168 type:complete len:86 (-) Transcript_41017:309-566(-)
MICKRDLTKETTEAIVNAANGNLQHGGGLAAAIARAGGKVIYEESYEYIRKHGPLKNGEVAVTNAGKMPSKKVIHAVGPIWRSGK